MAIPQEKVNKSANYLVASIDEQAVRQGEVAMQYVLENDPDKKANLQSEFDILNDVIYTLGVTLKLFGSGNFMDPRYNLKDKLRERKSFLDSDARKLAVNGCKTRTDKTVPVRSLVRSSEFIEHALYLLE